MAGRIYSQYPERKVTNGTKQADSGSGAIAKGGPFHDTPQDWPGAGGKTSRSFKRGTSWPRVKVAVRSDY